MKITFLGTGTSMGVPVVACDCEVCRSSDSHDHRFRTSVLLQTDGGANILIDIGPDFRMQMLRHAVTHIDAILVTHAHRDHVAGLDDIRPLNYIQQEPMQLYGNQVALDALQRDYHYIFAPHPYAGLPEVTLHILDGDTTFLAAGQRIVPIKAMHKDMPILGYRVGDCTYITDANHIEPEQIDKIKGSNVLVINALRKEKHFSHFSLPEALELVALVAPKKAFITHVSHEMGLHCVVEKELPENVHLAYDDLQVVI